MMSALVHVAAAQERNERLFYRVLCENFEELFPVVSSPVVRESCKCVCACRRGGAGAVMWNSARRAPMVRRAAAPSCSWDRAALRASLHTKRARLPSPLCPRVTVPLSRRYGLMFKSVPRALFISLEDRGRVFRILKNWPERNVKLVGRLAGSAARAAQRCHLPGQPRSTCVRFGGVPQRWCQVELPPPLPRSLCMQIVVSDGERTGAAGDLGVQAVGVPIK